MTDYSPEDLARVMAAHPVEVTVRNWPEAPWAKPRVIARTTFKTYVLDPAGTFGDKSIQICEYEPARARLVVQVIEAPIGIYTTKPNTTPDANAVAGQLSDVGRYLPNTLAYSYEFFGCDPMWINSFGTLTRVTVTKEYYA